MKDLSGGREEHRTGDLIDDRILGENAQIDTVRIVLGINIFPALHTGYFAHPVHEKHCGKEHAYFDRYYEVEDYGKYEGNKKDRYVTLR